MGAHLGTWANDPARTWAIPYPTKPAYEPIRAPPMGFRPFLAHSPTLPDETRHTGRFWAIARTWANYRTWANPLTWARTWAKSAATDRTRKKSSMTFDRSSNPIDPPRADPKTQ